MGIFSHYKERDIQSSLLHKSTGCLHRHIGGLTVSISGDIHVDVDGRGGAVCVSGQSFCHTYQSLHHSIHCCQLWSVDITPLYDMLCDAIFACLYQVFH